jgi:hypothetical protein
MSLAIDTDKVIEVLLADRWHAVLDDTFVIDSYEFVEAGKTVLGGGQDPLVSSMGFTFDEADRGGHAMSGPLTSILAVKTKQ